MKKYTVELYRVYDFDTKPEVEKIYKELAKTAAVKGLNKDTVTLCKDGKEIKQTKIIS